MTIIILSCEDGYLIKRDGSTIGNSVYARYISSGQKSNTNDMCTALGLTDTYLKTAIANLHSTISTLSTGVINVSSGGGPVYGFVLFKLYNNFYSAELCTYNQGFGLSVIKFCCNDNKFYGVRIRY